MRTAFIARFQHKLFERYSQNNSKGGENMETINTKANDSATTATITGTTKPPLGVKPKWVHDEQRREELKKGITRYLEAGMDIPNEWVEEYNSLVATSHVSQVGSHPVELARDRSHLVDYSTYPATLSDSTTLARSIPAPNYPAYPSAYPAYPTYSSYTTSPKSF